MENRFGVKDFFLLSLLVVIIIMIGLAMKQYDRQFQIVRDLQEQSHDQLRELEAIHRDLEFGGWGGMSSSRPAAQFINSSDDPFADLRALRNQGKYDQGDWLVQNFDAQVAKLTPFLGGDIYGAEVQARVQECLAYQDTQTLKWVPLLATSWKTTDNTPQWQKYVNAHEQPGKTDEDIGLEPDCPAAMMVDFQLRQGVTFSDGSPFTADDVVFTYDWTENPKVDAPRDREGLISVKSVEKVGDYEVVFKFNRPYFQNFATAAGIGVMSKKFYSAYTPEQYNDSVGLLIGTGPYRLESPTDWKPTTGKLELLRNERYWGLAPSFDKLVYSQVENETTSLVMYGNGELDVDALLPEQYELVKTKPEMMDHSNAMVYDTPLGGYTFIGWNETRKGKPFGDKRVREALTMLTDREGICKSIYRGYATPAPGPFAASEPQHDPTLQDWQYDPEKATALLKEAGIYDRAGNNVMTLPDGSPFSFGITYPAKSPTVDRMMQFIRDCYSRVGIDAQLDPIDWTIMDQRMKDRDFDAISLGWAGGSMEGDLRQMFHSSQILDQGDNFVSYSSSAFDTALTEAERTLDDDQRMEKWHECERILHEDQPYTFLTRQKLIRLFDKRLANVELAKTGLNFVQEWVMPIPWYVPRELQKYR